MHPGVFRAAAPADERRRHARRRAVGHVARLGEDLLETRRARGRPAVVAEGDAGSGHRPDHLLDVALERDEDAKRQHAGRLVNQEPPADEQEPRQPEAHRELERRAESRLHARETQARLRVLLAQRAETLELFVLVRQPLDDPNPRGGAWARADSRARQS